VASDVAASRKRHLVSLLGGSRAEQLEESKRKLAKLMEWARTPLTAAEQAWLKTVTVEDIREHERKLRQVPAIRQLYMRAAAPKLRQHQELKVRWTPNVPRPATRNREHQPRQATRQRPVAARGSPRRSDEDEPLDALWFGVSRASEHMVVRIRRRDARRAAA
jgi:hypothetical protein